MLSILKNKKVIFFDVGYTLDYPASGDWMITNKFIEIFGKKDISFNKSELQKTKDKAIAFLSNNHLILTEEAEYEQFHKFYSLINKELVFYFSDDEIQQIAYDRTYNMSNYIAYPDADSVLGVLSQEYKLGIISDTWPSIEHQLEALNLRQYFSFATYSCNLGVFKPDERMYLDALEKSGVRAEETVFIDDSVINLKGAAKCGITPILITANNASDVETEFVKIRSLTELLN